MSTRYPMLTRRGMNGVCLAYLGLRRDRAESLVTVPLFFPVSRKET